MPSNGRKPTARPTRTPTTSVRPPAGGSPAIRPERATAAARNPAASQTLARVMTMTANQPDADPLTWVLTLNGHWLAGGHPPVPGDAKNGGMP